MSPLFIKYDIFKEKVSKLLAEALLDKPTLFLIDLTITDAFKVIIFR
jgi:ribosome maturation factor RimP